MQEPLVSICCLTYNHEKYIDQCLAGFVLQKTTFSIEILIHEDASTDNTASIIKEYEAKYPLLFRCVYQTVNQFAIQNTLVNILFPMAKGKYIALCEGDDYWTDPYKLQKQVNALEESEDYFFCFSSVVMLNNNVKNIVRPDSPKFLYSIEDFILNQQILGVATYVFRNIMDKSLWNNKLICGDKFFTFYFASIGKAIYIDTPTAVYRDHGGGVHSKLSDSEKVNTVIHDFKIIDKELKYKYHLVFKQSLKLSVKYIYNTLQMHISTGQYSKARRDIIIWLKIEPFYKIIFKIRFKEQVKIMLGTAYYMKLFECYKFYKK